MLNTQRISCTQRDFNYNRVQIVEVLLFGGIAAELSSTVRADVYDIKYRFCALYGLCVTVRTGDLHIFSV
jgi:hypothetical protein